MVLDLFTKLSSIPNESVLFDLYPYIWDVKEVVLSLHSYVIWMATSHINGTPIPSLPRDRDFCNDDISVTDFIVDDFIEAWHQTYIGGVTVAMLRLLPFNGGFGFLDYAPDFPSSDLFHVRPFLDSDKVGNSFTFRFLYFLFNELELSHAVGQQCGSRVMFCMQ